MSEDCLFLNVFTPTLTPSTPLPVIFWIHGGFFIFGDGKLKDNCPDFILEHDVIMVSINYRLGVFGYFSTGDDIMPGNYGIKDQIMALEWVHNNIAKFGGDPARITLMGQSAGAANVALLLQAPLARGLFSAAIMESGTSLNLWSRTQDPEIIARGVANYFRIRYNTSQQLMTEIQKIPPLDLLAGAISVDLFDTALSNPVNGLLFGPTVEPLLQGAVTGMSHESLEKGKFSRVPVLAGYNSGEGNAFVSVFDYLRIYLKMYDFEPSKLVPVDLNAKQRLFHKIGKMIKQFYFGSKSITASRDMFVQFLTEHEFVRPANEFVRLLSNYTDTYFYRFSYMGELPEEDREAPGVDHGEELSYIFYSPDEKPPNAEDRITRKRLVKLWTNFAKYHNPTPTPEPLLQNVTWEPVQPTRINCLDIDKDLQMIRNPNEKGILFWKYIYNVYGVPPFDTY